MRTEPNPVTLYLDALAPSSRETQRRALEAMAGILSGGRLGAGELAWWELRPPYLRLLTDRLDARYAPSTVRRQLSALRGVLAACRDSGLMTDGAFRLAVTLPAEPVHARTRRPPAVRTAPGPGPTPRTFEIFLRRIVQSGRPLDRRDAALLSLLGRTGLYRSQIVALDVEHVHADTGRLDVPPAHGPAQSVEIDDFTRQFLAGWLDARGSGDGPLFPSRARRGRASSPRMTPQAVGWVLSRWTKRAGLPDWSPSRVRGLAAPGKSAGVESAPRPTPAPGRTFDAPSRRPTPAGRGT